MNLKDVQNNLIAHQKSLFQYGANSLSIFGSFAKNESTTKSDIDILVDFDSKKGLFGFIDLKNYLEKILKRHVDLVTKNALHPALKQKILQEAQHVF